MGKIVAIGGGEIRGANPDTQEINLEIKKMTGKERPKLVFIPTASLDSKLYVEYVQAHFGNRIGCEISALELLNKNYTDAELEKIIFSSDIVYVGGGNTKMMLEKWRETGLDRILVRVYQTTEIVLSGLSAGAICWFKYGMSDSDKSENPAAPYIKLPGLDLFNITMAPHFDAEEEVRTDFRKLLSETENNGLGLDNCCAIKIEDTGYQIISSRENTSAWLCKWENGICKETKLDHGSAGDIREFLPAPAEVQNK